MITRQQDSDSSLIMTETDLKNKRNRKNVWMIVKHEHVIRLHRTCM
jgi:hypothetical protein